MVLKKIIFISLLFLSITIRAQQYTFIPYGVEAGLAQSQVFTIEQDKYGYLWMGTLGGLSRFDGINFKNFSINDGLLSNHITTIKRLKNNDLVFAHPGGITYYNGLSFKALSMADSLGTSRITCLVETSAGLYLGTDNQGLYLLQDGMLSHIANNTFKNINVRDIKPFKKGILIAARRGMIQYDNHEMTWWKESDFRGISCSGIAIDNNSRDVWISSFGNGVYQVNETGITHYHTEHGLVANHVRGVFQSTDGRLWFFTKIGVSVLNEQRTFTTLNQKKGLAYDNVFTVLEDREHNIWFGTDGGGLFKYTGSSFLKYTTKNGLSSNLVMSIVQGDDSSYWFSTYDAGITRIYKDSISYPGVGNNTIWSSIRTKDGKLWFCSSEGIYIYEKGGFKHLSTLNGLIALRITAIYQDSKERVWLGAREGISIIDQDSIISIDAATGGFGPSVRCFAEDKQGNIVLGTANGLYQYKDSNFYALDIPGEWCNKTIQEIKISQNGWWIGTANGLQYYDGNEVTCVKLNNNFSSNYINYIEVLGHEIWIGTNNGLFLIDEENFLKTGEVNAIRFTKHEGFSSLETNLHASYQDNLGNLWFGTADGVFKYAKAEKGSFKEVPPFVNINNVQLFLQNPDWKKKKVKIDPTTGLPTNLIVPHKDNYFTFLYTGLNYSNPLDIQYQFMLEGFDENWLPPTKANFATYSNLPHGEFTFRVKCINKKGIESQIEAFHFNITPPFWLTWWFYVLVSLFAFLLLYLAYQWRKNFTQRKKRTQQLIDQSKMLGLEQQTLNASMNRHFIFNSLNSIQYYINRQDKLAANKYLTRFAKLIRKNLDSSEEISCLLHDEIERLELYLSLELMRFNDKFEYKITIHEDIDPDNIYVPSMLLQPFVENSIWHGILPSGKKGCVEIEILPEDDKRIRLIIKDDGIGIEKSLAAKNDRISQHNSKGMKITQDRIKLLQKMTGMKLFLSGPKDIKHNKLTYGTIVEMVLPRENAQLYY